MRYIIKFSYDGTNYSGYQRQKDKPSIQQEIEEVLSKVLKEDISIVASGRTDAGVSAIEQICHMDYKEMIDGKRICGYANSLLPKSIRLHSMEIADNDFHARYSAKKKTYEYLFYTGSVDIPVYENIASHIGYNVDIDKMKESCKYILGEHDFSSFCASNTSIKDKVRVIYDMGISEVGERLYKLTITGNGFLYNMVRIIMGTLSDVGVGKINVEDIIEIINAKDRSKAGKTANAKGLYLKKVVY